jgi:hypothetical protein
MSAIETLLAGLIDYAGLYPPAALDMRTAVRNYLDYRAGARAFVLGRFIVDTARLEEMRKVAGDASSHMPLSVIAGANAPNEAIAEALDKGLLVESVEIKCDEPLTIRRISERLPLHLNRYFEIPIQSGCTGAIEAIASIGARAKLRMGGVVPEAFPAPDHVIEWLRLVADRGVPFKATAGLHHPIRSRHRLTYTADSPCAVMYGSVNLFCAAALVYDGELAQARAVLDEENPAAFRIMPDCLAWRSHEWSTEHVDRIRKKFFTSFGSCSFVEPLQDLEALGWL